MLVPQLRFLALLFLLSTGALAAERAAVDHGPLEATAVSSISDSTEPSDCPDEDNCTCDKGRLLGILAPTNTDYSAFISPMTNPVFFEDPRTLTEARVIFVHHTVPDRAPLAGGDVNLIAAQVRAALTDRLSIIATKDGFFTFSNEIPLDANDGWADIAAGLKYNLYSDPCRQRLLSAGTTFEMPVGSPRALQGNGSGEFNLFLTGGTQLGERAHFVTAAGLRLPADDVEESQVAYWSAHLDTQLRESRWYVFGETNWYHWMNSGEALPLSIEGLDVFNFGSANVAGNDIVSGAVGFKFKPTVLNEIGVAFEVPLTDRRDVLEDRLTVDCIIRY